MCLWLLDMVSYVNAAFNIVVYYTMGSRSGVVWCGYQKWCGLGTRSGVVWCGYQKWCGVVWVPEVVWCGVGTRSGVVRVPEVVWCGVGTRSGVVWCEYQKWCGVVWVPEVVWSGYQKWCGVVWVPEVVWCGVDLGFSPLIFPAITVCNINRIQKSKLKMASTELQELSAQIQSSKIAKSMKSHRAKTAKTGASEALEPLQTDPQDPPPGNESDPQDPPPGNESDPQDPPTKSQSDPTEAGDSSQLAVSSLSPINDAPKPELLAESTTPAEESSDPPDTPNDPPDTPNDPPDTPNDPPDTPNDPQDTPNDPPDTPNDPSDTPNDPPDTPNDPPDTTNDPPDTTNDPPDTGEEPTDSPPSASPGGKESSQAEDLSQAGTTTTTTSGQTKDDPGSALSSSGSATNVSSVEPAQPSSVPQSPTRAQESDSSVDPAGMTSSGGSSSGSGSSQQQPASSDPQARKRKRKRRSTLSETLEMKAPRVKRFIEGFDVNETSARFQPNDAEKALNIYSGNKTTVRKIEDELKYLYSDFQLFQTLEYGNCYSIESSQFISADGGPSDGLELLMYLDGNNYMEGMTTSKAGVQVLVHDPGTWLLPYRRGFAVPAAMETFVALRQVNVARASQPYGSCQTDHPNLKAAGIKYTRTACQTMCMQKAIYATCGCYDATAEELNLRIINETSLHFCQDNLEIACISQIESDFLDGTLTCECDIACSAWPSDDYAAVLVEYLCSWNASACESFQGVEPAEVSQLFFKLLVYFEDLNYEDITEKPAYALSFLMV
ncbi:hypothetical protein ACOMHN_001718 [Nucella lapillus]